MTNKDYFIRQVEAHQIPREEGKNIDQERHHTTEVVLFLAVGDRIDKELEAKRKALQSLTPQVIPEAPWEKEYHETWAEFGEDKTPTNKDSVLWLRKLEERKQKM